MCQCRAMLAPQVSIGPDVLRRGGRRDWDLFNFNALPRTYLVVRCCSYSSITLRIPGSTIVTQSESG